MGKCFSIIFVQFSFSSMEKTDAHGVRCEKLIQF